MILKFHKDNLQHFKVKDEIKVGIAIKNVPHLTVKVYEFNTETYLVKHGCNINNEINLDGLESSLTVKREYKYPPNVKHNEVFTFPELKEKVGLFMIDFYGNGISTRATI